MTIPMPDGMDSYRRLTEARATGESAGGLVQVEADGTGDLTRLRIEPAAMRLPSEDLADAVVEAFKAARATVLESVQREVSEQAVKAGLPDVSALFGGLENGAMRRLDDLTDLAQRLSDRLSRP